MDKLHKFFDPMTGRSWLVNLRTHIVRDRDGNFAEDAEAERILARVESRRRSASARRGRDQARRDIGLVKVRGSAGGTFWE